MGNDRVADLLENKRFKISLLFLLVGLVLFYTCIVFYYKVYAPFYALEPYERPFTEYSLLDPILNFIIFPVFLFGSSVMSGDGSLGVLLFGPIFWSIYFIIGSFYIKFGKPRSYFFLLLFIALLVYNVVNFIAGLY